LLEYRWAEGHQERFPGLAEELVRLNPDLIVTLSASAILALKRATATIPIIFAGTSDPVRSGFAVSLSRPGGNLTGLSLMAPDLAGKRLALVKLLVPGASRIAALWNASDERMAIRVKEAQLAAPALNVILLSPEIRTVTDLESALSALARDRPDALLIFVDPFTLTHRRLRQQQGCPLFTKIGSLWRLVVSCRMGQAWRTIADVPLDMWTGFSKGQNPPIYRLSSPRNLNKC
jgi:putative ABC transport system substrate-binding protein